MNLYLTNGFHGERSVELLQNMKYKTASQVLNAIAEWKKQDHNKELYRIEPYDRFIFYDDCIVVDFGDYYTFIEVTDMTEDEMRDFQDELGIMIKEKQHDSNNAN